MRRPRRGYTLVEVLVTMSVLVVILSAGATTIGLLLRSEGRGAESLAVSNTLARLSDHFRRDVHAAVRAELCGTRRPEEAVRLEGPDGILVEYRASSDGILRQESRSPERLRKNTKAITSKEASRRSRFVLPRSQVRFHLSEDGRWVSLFWRQRPLPPGPRTLHASPSAPGGRVVPITAALALDHRFEELE